LQCEFVGTFFLIYCALMIEERPFILPEEFEPIWKAIAEPFFVGWMVVACVMSMAGPTGYAANPARDMGPRIAHFLLPIPNKGPSEFWYVWLLAPREGVPVSSACGSGFLQFQ
jgi:glycerol uptake facilitator protein